MADILNDTVLSAFVLTARPHLPTFFSSISPL